MIFCEQFYFLLRIFVLFGLKPATILETNLQKCINVICVIIPSILDMLITSYLVLYPHLTSYGIISVLIYYASFIPSILMIFTANGQCFFNKNSYQKIGTQIVKVEKILKEKALRLSLQCVAHRYRRKIIFIYSLFFLSQGFLFAEVWFLDSPHLLSSFFISLLRTMHPLQLFHLILYIDIIGMFFHELNEEIKNSPINAHSTNKIEFLKYVKLMHMNLWKLVGQINNFFGWNLLFTAMHLFIYVTHQFYWIFLSTHDKVDVLALVGKGKRDEGDKYFVFKNEIRFQLQRVFHP